MAKRGRKKGSTNKKIKNEKNKVNLMVASMLIASVLLAVLIYTNAGFIGEYLSPFLGGVMGTIKNVLPIGLFLLAIYVAYQNDKTGMLKVLQFAGILCAISTILTINMLSNNTIVPQQGNEFGSVMTQCYKKGELNQGGGVIGGAIAYLLQSMIGNAGTVILSVGVILLLIVSMFGLDIANAISNFIDSSKEGAKENARRFKEKIEEEPRKETKKERLERERREKEAAALDIEQLKINLNNKQTEEYRPTDDSLGSGLFGKRKEKKPVLDPEVDDVSGIKFTNIERQKEEELRRKQQEAEKQNEDLFKTQEKDTEDTKTKEVLQLEHAKMWEDENYVFPPIKLLGIIKNKSKSDSANQLEVAQRLQKTLKSFGVMAKVENVSEGPAITRYELKPAEGVRVSKIANLADDIALNLEAETIRIEAPIPGKHAVGIEVPNRESKMVGIRELLESDEFQEKKSKLAFALGKNVSGGVVVADIAKFPHAMIAGATGSGKSVCINTLITSLIYKAKPSEVKMIMIDPKIVELSVYNGIPHLLIPVVTDPKKAAGALAWAVQEMENRYAMFAAKGVRDLAGYNEKISKEDEQIGKLPHIVIIVDELADLMMVAKNDVEDSICRLAQKARAAGMHLIIATQRPSVDVITGLIKANIPSRIAFAVSSQVDSRTILDQVGAEKLLGKGDMLFFPTGEPKPIRIQGAYVSDSEVEGIVNFLKSNIDVDENIYRDDIEEFINTNQTSKDAKATGGDVGMDDDDDGTDPLLNEAIEMVIESRQASTSYIQRKLKVGYARAGRIIDQMEERGIISGYQGSKPREVLMSRERWYELNMQRPAEGSTEE